jgi:predicted transcriptional regulator
MSRLPLHTLPSFRVIARTGNLRAAAEELHLTHSAVSQQLRQLETTLGVKLFGLHGRDVVLALDDDKAGRVASDKIAAIVRPVSAKLRLWKA